MGKTLNLGNGNWATKKDSLLAYNSENGNFKPLPFSFSRATSATVVNKDGLIETVGSGEPRIDYKDDSKGALLLEPSRSNVLVQSNQFDTTWLKNNVTILGGQSGIYGSSDAWLLQRGDGLARFLYQNVSISSSSTLSIYAKKGNSDWLFLSSGAGENKYFDLENGVIGNVGTASDSQIEAVGDGWYRCSITVSNGESRIYPAVGDGVVSGLVGANIYIQSAQLEVGSYATSYIPTQGGAVTRVQDACYNDNLGNIIGQTEGTFYLETVPLSSTTSFTERIMQFESSGSDFMTFQRYANSNLTFFGTDGSNNWTIQGLNLFVGGETIKIAGAYKDNDIVLYVNGVQIGTNNTVNAPQTQKLRFANNPSGSLAYSGSHKEVKIYNTRLSNTELQALTKI